MDKILSSESPLHFLPKEIGDEKLMLLDSLRFTLEMIDYCSSQLMELLEKISLDQEHKVHFKVFHYAWSIIDHAQRFQKLYKTLSPQEDSIIKKLSYVDKFRNAIQHVDLNLKADSNLKMINNGRPIYGALKWGVFDSEKEEVYTSILISGIFNIQNIRFKQHEKNKYSTFINEIILETDTLNKKDDNEINLSQLISDISEISIALDKKLNQQITSHDMQKLDWKSRKDVLLCMKNERTSSI